MAKKKNYKLDFEDQTPLSQSPFAALGNELGVAPTAAGKQRSSVAEKAPMTPATNPMLLVRMEKRGKGKVVTRVHHLETDASALLKKLKRILATGGALREGVLELQGDHRGALAEILQREGYKLRLGN